MNSKRISEVRDKLVMYDPLTPYDKRMEGLDEYIESELARIIDFYRREVSTVNDPVPYVFLSSDICKKTYGKLTEQELIIKLKDYLNNMPEVPMYKYFKEIILCIIYNLELSIKSIAEGVFEEDNNSFIVTLSGAERLVNLEGLDEDKRVFNGIVELVNQLKVTNTILGEYIPRRHQIIIYYEAVRREVFNGNKHLNYYSKLSSVLAHEYFHACHYLLAPGHSIWNGKSSSGISACQKNELKEALAEYFSVMWCYNQSTYEPRCYIEVAEDRFKSWRNNLYSAWPYGKVLYLFRIKPDEKIPVTIDENIIGRAYHKFKMVYEKSVRDNIAYLFMQSK